MSHHNQKKERQLAFLFLTPNFICFFAFTLFPIIASFILSFTKWDILSSPEFIGIQNYIDLFTDDPIFLQVLANTLIFTVLSVPTTVVLSLLVAVALNTRIRGRNIYRTCFFLPLISSSVIVAVLWKWLLVPDFGLVNYILSWFGIKGPNWLTDEFWALPAISFVSVWKNIGFNMLIYLAGLQGIPDTYYEAVEIDGGGKITQFFHITLPLLSSTTFFVFIMSIINSFQSFDIVKLMTDGGPGRSTSVLSHYLYENAFSFFKMGYASAISYILFGLVMIITLFQFAIQKRRDR